MGNTRKEQLQKELNAIVKSEEKALIEAHYPDIKRRFQGKYFKADNGYSGDERWPMYTKVVEIKPSDVYDTRGAGVTAHFKGWTFQTDTRGSVTISQELHGYIHLLEEEISEKQFIREFNKVISRLKKLSQ